MQTIALQPPESDATLCLSIKSPPILNYNQHDCEEHRFRHGSGWPVSFYQYDLCPCLLPVATRGHSLQISPSIRASLAWSSSGTRSPGTPRRASPVKLPGECAAMPRTRAVAEGWARHLNAQESCDPRGNQSFPQASPKLRSFSEGFQEPLCGVGGGGGHLMSHLRYVRSVGTNCCHAEGGKQQTLPASAGHRNGPCSASQAKAALQRLRATRVCNACGPKIDLFVQSTDYQGPHFF